MRMDEMEALMTDFTAEANAHLTAMEAGLLQLESQPHDEATINTVFRAAHSIKGTAGFFQLDNIVLLAHAIENLFGEIRDSKLLVTAPLLDCLLAAVDRLKLLVGDVKHSQTLKVADCVENLKRFLAQPTLQTIVPKVESADARVKEADNQTKPLYAASAETGEDESIRVSVRLLDELLTTAGEMVLYRNQLLHIAQTFGSETPQLDAVSKGIDGLTTNLQKTVMQARMQPVGHVFNKLPRMVRDLSRKLGKEVDLTLQGMEVELDRSLIELLADPLVHLIRNALDHGFETPAERQANGKPAAGVLTVRAYNMSGWVVVDVCDDGAGMNPEAIKQCARRKSLASEAELAVMSEEALLNLVMLPGFSTTEKPNALSGRGVGLDVVRSNIEQLGGKAEIFSDYGRGTTVRLTLPITLEIMSAFIVEAAGQPFIIPQKSVSELLLIQAGQKSNASIEHIHTSIALRLRGRLFPLIRLRDILQPQKQENWFDEFTHSEDLLRVLVIKSGHSAYGLVVDVVNDIEEILSKPMSALLGDCDLYSGVTVLGDGSIAMILDTDKLQHLAGGITPIDEPGLRQERPSVTVDEDQYILLFNTFGGETLGLDLTMVARVEKVAASQLQKVGTKYYFAFQGRMIRVICPEFHLPLSRQKGKNKNETMYIILPKWADQKLGIAAASIVDTVQTNIVLEQNGPSGIGIFGSALINNRVVTLLNLHELFLAAAPEYYRLSPRKTPVSGDKESKTRQLRVLLAEDDPFFLKVIKSYLESDGYQVITAVNGEEALVQLHAAEVDLVVSDIEMPVMNGLDLVRAIRNDEQLRRLPVVAVTSLVGDAHKEKGLRAGFDFYEHKLDRTHLLNRLRGILQNPAKVSEQYDDR